MDNQGKGAILMWEYFPKTGGRKKMKAWFKRILSLAMALTLLLGCFPVSSSAAPLSGRYGDNLTWTLDAAGHLTFFGKGEMMDLQYNSTGDPNEDPLWDYRNSITSITIPKGVTSIGDYAFEMCFHITSVEIPSTVTRIGVNAFVCCNNLSSLTIPESVKIIAFGAFQNCVSLTGLKIPSGVRTIEPCTFFNCASLTEIKLPAGLTSIEDIAFQKCSGLTTVILPDSLTRIADRAFDGCTNIEEVYYAGTQKQWVDISISAGNEALLRNLKFNQSCQYQHTAKKVDAKPATLSKDGCKSYYACSACGKLFTNRACTNETTKAQRIVPAVAKIRLSETSYTYDGKTKRPSVGVYDAKGNKLVKDTHYTVSYSSGRKAVGEYKVTIKGKGEYSFTKTLTFKINPPKTGISSLTAKAKSFVAKWSKKTSQVAGYQLQYSTTPDFSSGVETITIKDNTATSKTVKGLKAKKTYYVRIRTYKKVDSKNFYSDWSSVKTVKTK